MACTANRSEKSGAPTTTRVFSSRSSRGVAHRSEQANSGKALWAEQPSNVTDEEANEFYRTGWYLLHDYHTEELRDDPPAKLEMAELHQFRKADCSSFFRMLSGVNKNKGREMHGDSMFGIKNNDLVKIVMV